MTMLEKADKLGQLYVVKLVQLDPTIEPLGEMLQMITVEYLENKDKAIGRTTTDEEIEGLQRQIFLLKERREQEANETSKKIKKLKKLLNVLDVVHEDFSDVLTLWHLRALPFSAA